VSNDRAPAERFGQWVAGGAGAALTVRVIVRASRTALAGLLPDGTLKVRVAAAPTGGAANRALIAYLAKLLGIRENAIESVAGEKGRNKILAISNLGAREVDERLRRSLPVRRRTAR
jgi:uncharacterized protein YggU (UPF0235/DUF167 family)